jgi:hypothetical protein
MGSLLLGVNHVTLFVSTNKTIIVCGGVPDTTAAAVHCSPVAVICVLRELMLYVPNKPQFSDVMAFFLLLILKFDLKSERSKFSYVFRSIESRSGDRSGTDGRCEREVLFK